MPQTYWLAGAKHLLRFEHLDEDITKLGLGPMKKVNCSERKDWKEYYTPELKAIVYDLYKCDFALISAIP
ncbi:hypothetical protein KDA11_03265, partial [Candidatus Saccharibacteria bacterium]|nr:hypothetical protein [Candidatus Saccharibacteria bacterium]